MASPWKTFFGAVLCLLTMATASKASSKACIYQPSILSLADGLLKDLDSKDPGFARHYGRDAAYLKMHYGSMSEVDTDRMLARLLGKGVTDSLGFTYAYYISRYGFEAAKMRIGKDNLAYFDTHPYDLTLIRELALAGRYDLVIDNLKRNGHVKGAPYNFPVSLAFIEFPPEKRLRFADIADKAKLTFLAGGLYASLPDYSAWPGFLKRNYGESGFKGARLYYLAFSGYNPSSPPLPDPRNSVNGQLARQLIQTVIAASWLSPGSALLYQYMLRNWSEPIYAKRAAMTLKQAYDQGKLRPEDPMEKGWLLTYRALALASGDPVGTRRKMQTVQIGSRHYLQASAIDSLDTMLAADAIGPWLAGQSKAFPAIPALASDKLKAEWPEWRKLAEAIKAGTSLGNLGIDIVQRGMAADLLYTKGDQSALLKLIAEEPNPAFRQRLEADFMARYDRHCDSSLYFPGDALFLRTTTIHRFKPPK